MVCFMNTSVSSDTFNNSLCANRLVQTAIDKNVNHVSDLPQNEGDAMATLTPAIRRAIGHEPAAYRLAVFGILHGSDGQLVGALVRCGREWTWL